MVSGYIAFCNDKRATLKAGLSFGQAGKELGKLWKALSEGEKAKYTAKGAAAPKAAAKPKSGKKGK